jgi:acetylornithine deacetylase/succinyl-diaminopimelate desuccinylase-like protein
MTLATLRADVEAALARLAPETPGATIALDLHPELGWVEPTEVAPDHPAVRAVQSAAERELGAEPPLAAFPGATDAWGFQGIGGVPTIAAFGPGLLPLAHGPNEWVSLTSLEQAARMYALAALAFGATGGAVG